MHKPTRAGAHVSRTTLDSPGDLPAASAMVTALRASRARRSSDPSIHYFESRNAEARAMNSGRYALRWIHAR